MNAERWSNILSVERAFRAGRSLPGGKPLEAYIEVAARCNLRCIMCPITVDPRYQPGSGWPGLLAPEHFERLRPIFSTLQRAYLFGLGEPMLNPNLFVYASELSDAGVEVWITTNGTLVDDERAEAFVESGVHRVSVSIDGATRETYERIRKGAAWEDLRRGLEALGRVRRCHGRPRFVLMMVGMASNLEELPSLVELAAHVGADGVYLEMIYDWPHPELHEVYRREHPAHLGEARVQELVAEGKRLAGELGLEFRSRLDDWSGRINRKPAGSVYDAAPPTASPVETGDDSSRTLADLVQIGPTPKPIAHAPGHDGLLPLSFPCSEPWQMINVSAAGEVRTCCFNSRIYGRLTDSTFEEIWNGEPYTHLRRFHAARRSPPECGDCVQSWRVKRSPHLLPPEDEIVPPCNEGDVGDREVPRLIAPADGELIASSKLVIAGHLARGSRIARWLGDRAFSRKPRLPEVWFDATLLARVQDVGVLDGDRFALVIDIDFVTEGSHWLTIRPPQSEGSQSLGSVVWDSRHLQVGKIEGNSGSREGDPAVLAAVSRVAFHVDLTCEQRQPRLHLDGAEHPLACWICGTYGCAWRGIGVVDLVDVPPGLHRLELEPRHDPPCCFVLHRLALAEP